VGSVTGRDTKLKPVPVKAYDRELDTLARLIAEMGGIAEKMVIDAVDRLRADLHRAFRDILGQITDSFEVAGDADGPMSSRRSTATGWRRAIVRTVSSSISASSI